MRDNYGQPSELSGQCRLRCFELFVVCLRDASSNDELTAIVLCCLICQSHWITDNELARQSR